jgi:acetyl esterase/lipase
LTDAYATGQDMATHAKNPLVSPLLAMSHQELPPAYFQIAGMDPLRDEGLLYEQVLRESGVKTKVDMSVILRHHTLLTDDVIICSYPGVPHGFINLPITARTKHREDLQRGIQWLMRSNA